MLSEYLRQLQILLTTLHVVKAEIVLSETNQIQ